MPGVHRGSRPAALWQTRHRGGAPTDPDHPARLHLCEVAKEAIDRVVAATGDRYLEVDVESDLELEREYGERSP